MKNSVMAWLFDMIVAFVSVLAFGILSLNLRFNVLGFRVSFVGLGKVLLGFGCLIGLILIFLIWRMRKDGINIRDSLKYTLHLQRFLANENEKTDGAIRQSYVLVYSDSVLLYVKKPAVLMSIEKWQVLLKAIKSDYAVILHRSAGAWKTVGTGFQLFERLNFK